MAAGLVDAPGEHVRAADATRSGPFPTQEEIVRLADAGLPARVELVEDLGDAAILDLALGDMIVEMRTDRRPAAREGDPVLVAFGPSAVHLFDPATGERR